MCSLAGWTGADGLGRKQRRRGYERARGWRPALRFLSLSETIVRLQHSPIFLLPGPLLPRTLAAVLGVPCGARALTYAAHLSAEA